MTSADQTMIRYLLGELSEAEQTALEQRYFTDPALFDQVVEAENELLDKYSRGLLPPPTRTRFEQYYMAHPRRLERAKFAATLTTKIDRINEDAATSAPHPESSWRRLLASVWGPRLALGFSVVLLLLIGGVVWFAIETRRLHQEIARNETARVTQEQRERELQEQVANERARADQLANELGQAQGAEQQTVSPSVGPSPTPPKAPAPALATLTLTVAGVRGAEAVTPALLVIPLGANQALLRLNLKENDYQAYSVVVQSADGKQIFKRDRLQVRNKARASLSVIIPANKFSVGDYILTLKGVAESGEVEDVSKSLFRVEKK